MKMKIYIAPMIELHKISLSPIMAGSSNAESEIDNGNGPSGPTDKDDGSDESDAKQNFNVWSNWD